MIDDSIINKLYEKVKKRAPEAKRYPVSTYRLQFNRGFTFRDAAALVPYLHALGITDIYASPYLKARPGSMHGYDITDHNALNPEIGTAADYRRFVDALHRHGMSQVLDFVPNHMSTIDNPWWSDVLENGMSSPYAQFFDIDWYPVKTELREKVLLPILEDQYGKVLEAGQFQLAFHQGAFFISYRECLLPVGLGTAALPLEICLEQLRETLSESHTDYLEMQSIITACRNLPARSETKPERISEMIREKKIIRKRLWELYQRNKKVQTSIAEMLHMFNGKAGDNESFNRLHELLEQQAYRLSYWRVALDEINYRRFFDINELVALQMENRQVFYLCHKLLHELLRQGAVAGVRIDHVDGLFNACEYLRRLQQIRLIGLCRDAMEQNNKYSGNDLIIAEEKLLEKLEEEPEINQGSALLQPLYVVVEKILGEKENLRDAWPVDGTTGYEFATLLNGIFVNRRNARSIRNIYRWFTKTEGDFKDIAYDCKVLIMDTSMSAETNVLAHRLDRVSEKSRRYRDFTLNSLMHAIREVIACFPVYRTYINALENAVSDRDRVVINMAVVQAKRRNPALSGSLFDFLHDTLLLKYPPDMDEEGRREQQQFVMRFQQLTGPVMAKGVEATAFYRYNPLTSLNDVGSNPGCFGNTVDEFHRHNTVLLKNWPHSLLATSTHDSKRSEDVRARINVLSEIPKEWKASLGRWSRFNRRKKTALDGESVPDKNEEYLIYQTLLGTYPAGEMSERERDTFTCRIHNYVLKAIREAKVHTSWVNQDTAYEENVMAFVTAILDSSPSNLFLADFLKLNKQVAYGGMYNSLSQVVLKTFSPGTPDFYQGNELWNFCLVDPDNRGPVDFTYRTRLLESIKERAGGKNALTGLAKELAGNLENGEIKLYVTWKALDYRRRNPLLFNDGNYVPLEAIGGRKANVCAFAWQKANRQLLVSVPRMITRLTQNGTAPPTGPQAWGDTLLVLPGRLRKRTCRNIFTGELVEVTTSERRAALPMAEVMATFPVAALELIPD